MKRSLVARAFCAVLACALALCCTVSAGKLTVNGAKAASNGVWKLTSEEAWLSGAYWTDAQVVAYAEKSGYRTDSSKRYIVSDGTKAFSTGLIKDATAYSHNETRIEYYGKSGGVAIFHQYHAWNDSKGSSSEVTSMLQSPPSQLKPGQEIGLEISGEFSANIINNYGAKSYFTEVKIGEMDAKDAKGQASFEIQPSKFVNYKGKYSNTVYGYLPENPKDGDTVSIRWKFNEGRYYWNYTFEEESKTGIKQDSDGIWRLYENGVVQTQFTGLYNDKKYGWWLIKNGQVDFAYTGLYCDATYGWWLIGGGGVAFNYTGLWNDAVQGWWLVDHGCLASWVTGLYNDTTYGWWLISGGGVAFDYTGVWYDVTYGAWNIEEGRPTTPVEIEDGLHCDSDGVWRLYLGGKVADEYLGLYNDATYGWWLIDEGAVDWIYDGLWEDKNFGWWLVRSGRVDFTADGIWYDTVYGGWKILGGTVDWEYTGPYTDPVYGTVYVVNGQVVDEGGNG